jgi:superfamily I DNA and/or RNA helicase
LRSELRNAQVLSVDKVQGAEADATVITLVKTRPELSPFFQDERRVCVALSRAKHISVIVGKSSFFQSFGCKNVWKKVVTRYGFA